MINLEEAKRIAGARTQSPDDARAWFDFFSWNTDSILAELEAARSVVEAVSEAGIDHDDDCPSSDDYVPHEACECGAFQINRKMNAYRALKGEPR